MGVEVDSKVALGVCPTCLKVLTPDIVPVQSSDSKPFCSEGCKASYEASL